MQFSRGSCSPNCNGVIIKGPIKELKMRIAAILAVLFTASYTMFAQGTGGGSLVTKVSPGRAGVFVDGKYVGPASSFRIARTYAVAAGEHEIKLVDPRYEEVVTEGNHPAGEEDQAEPDTEAPAPGGAAFWRVAHSARQ